MVPTQKALPLARFGMPLTALLFADREWGRFDQADEGRLGAEQAEQVPPEEASTTPPPEMPSTLLRTLDAVREWGKKTIPPPSTSTTGRSSVHSPRRKAVHGEGFDRANLLPFLLFRPPNASRSVPHRRTPPAPSGSPTPRPSSS